MEPVQKRKLARQKTNIEKKIITLKSLLSHVKPKKEFAFKADIKKKLQKAKRELKQINKQIKDHGIKSERFEINFQIMKALKPELAEQLEQARADFG